MSKLYVGNACMRSADNITEERIHAFPTDIFDYIYARLHSPLYREKYKEFLKIDFPRVPYPETAEEFWHYVKIGRKLRKLHLMDGVEPDNHIANFNVAGSNIVGNACMRSDNDITKELIHAFPTNNCFGKVYINDTQYFDNVPLVAWEFYIGGYQPAQKWLKDRKGKSLSYDDIIHYQKIIHILKATNALAKKIDLE